MQPTNASSTTTSAPATFSFFPSNLLEKISKLPANIIHYFYPPQTHAPMPLPPVQPIAPRVEEAPPSQPMAQPATQPSTNPPCDEKKTLRSRLQL